MPTQIQQKQKIKKILFTLRYAPGNGAFYKVRKHFLFVPDLRDQDRLLPDCDSTVRCG